jgi:peptide/nickel transport system substrate-binding protein
MTVNEEVRFVRRQRRSFKLLALLFSLVFLAAACGDDDDDEGGGGQDTTTTAGEAAEGGTVTFASDQEPTGWNINTASDNLFALGQIVQHVYPQTFDITPEFEVVMNEDLLESAEVTSDDPQTIEFVIRDDAVWSDGTPISADDFIYLWQQVINPDNDVASTTGFEDIESVEGSEDGKTVTVVFSQAFADWQSLFNNILPAHIMETAAGGWNDALDGTNIPAFSGGPIMLQDYVPEQSITIVPNPEYWGDRQMQLDEVVVRFGITADAVAAALENGEIDMAGPQPQLDLVAQVEDLAPEVDYQITFGLTFEHIDFNLDNPLLADPAVRQAIALAMDEEDLVNRTVGQFSDEAEPLYNRLWLNTQPEYEPHGDDYQGVDVEAAKSVLEDAGYTAGGDGIYEKDGQRLSFRISTTGGNALRESSQQILQQQLQEAGIELTIDNLQGAAVFDKFFPEEGAQKDFDIALFAWVGNPFVASQKALYTTGSGQNEMNYTNTEVDTLLEESVRTVERSDAADLLNQVDELLWEDLPTVPLYTKPNFLAFRSSIQNVQDNASTAGPLWNLYDWSLSEG